jgi:hypothetical protein
MKKIGIAIGLFIIALLPRIFDLGLFITSDEPLWLTRSMSFSEALLTGRLAETLQTGHPGVTTMWTGSLGLVLAYLQRGPSTPFLEFLQALPHNFERIDATLLPWARLPTVLLAALGVALFYWLARKLVDDNVALIGALLLAFDPLFLAHSRTLHHDALATIFMSLSVLALLNYAAANQFSARVYLVWSGGLAGLALLSKGTSLALAAFATLFFLWRWVRQKQSLGQTVVAGLIWLGMAVGVFVALWPAMWVIPGQVLAEVFGWIITSADVAEIAETTSLNWAGRVPDLGVLFYPVNWLLKSTLLSLVGLVALVGWWRAPQNRGQRWVLGWLAMFAMLFVLVLTIGDKRDGRYLLPIYPGLWLLTAAGLGWLAQRILDAVESRRGNALRLPQGATARVRPYEIRTLTKVGLMIIFTALLAGFSLPWYPYYHSYYNPIIGGSWLAPRLVKVGWGEGMEQAAAYLNQQPQAEQLVVATSYAQNFLPFFVGQSVKHHQSQPSDYVLNYIRQIQNGYPYPEYWQYYQARQPVYHLKQDGLDYLWLYKESSLVSVRDARFGNELELMGFTLTQGFTLAQRFLEPGATSEVTLVWRVTGELPKTTMVRIQLIDDEGQVWGEALPGPVIDPAGPSAVEGHYQLSVSPDAPRFDGHLLVSVAGGQGQSFSQTIPGPFWVRRTSLPASAVALPEVTFGDRILLLGYQVSDTTIKAGEPIEVTLYWQAQASLNSDYTVFTQLLTLDGRMWGQHDAQPANGQLPTTIWTVGEVVADSHRFTVAPDAPPGDYQLIAGMYRWDTGERLPLAGDTTGQNAQMLLSIKVQ